jgi:hypothetical protein
MIFFFRLVFSYEVIRVLKMIMKQESGYCWLEVVWNSPVCLYDSMFLVNNLNVE